MISSQIEEIKNRLDVIEVIGSYIKLKKTGANYRGVCPFHSEKKPSFFVSPARQLWHCFGCGEGSSMFDFVMKIEGVEFGDALRILAQKAGIELKREDPQFTTARQRLYEILDLACRFFEKQLEGNVGIEAKKYLLGRGINEESIKKWRLGYSPNTWQSLSEFLIGKGYKREEIEKAGLAVKSENAQNSYDRFRGRIIFPVFDLNSQVIGFGARVFLKTSETEVAKYINTPQTMLYDKSHTLYGLNFAKLPIRKQGQCVITEGYTDTIMAHQAGFDNTIAVSGTALTGFHLELLKRYAENLVLAFDMDLAGNTATKRGIDIAQETGFNLKVIGATAKDSDPADVILKDPKEWEKSVDSARSVMDFYFDSALASNNKDAPEGKKNIARMILPAIKRIPNMIEQSFWVQKLASVLSVQDSDILAELKKVKIENLYEVNSKPEDVIKTVKLLEPVGRKNLIEEKIIALILKNPENLSLLNPENLLMFSLKSKEFIQKLKDSGFEAQKEDPKKFIDSLLSKQSVEGNDELRNLLSALSLRAEVEYDEDSEEEIQLCLSELKSVEIRNKLKELTQQLKKAEEIKDADKMACLMQEFNNLSKEL